MCAPPTRPAPPPAGPQAKGVDVLFLRGVRELRGSEGDQATRLATLVDAAYDEGTALVLSLEPGLEGFSSIFVPLLVQAAAAGADITVGVPGHRGGAPPGPLSPAGTTVAGRVGQDGVVYGGLGMVEEQVLMWRRCASRVAEMCRGRSA